MKVMNSKTHPTFLSDMLVGNFGELVNNLFSEDVVSSNIAFRPAIEVKELEDQFEIQAALPGIKKEEITIEVEDNRLKISGERSSSSTSDNDKTHVSEFRYGKFERSILLPKNADYDKIEALFEDGILKVLVPKQEILKPKNILIK